MFTSQAVRRLLVAVVAFGACLPLLAENPTVEVKTSMGTFEVELYADKAPVTVKNFLDYVNAKFYDGTIFHRVVPGFVIQGGGFTAQMDQKKTNAPIKNEASNGVSNTSGTLSMARTMDPNSATSQFYVNMKDNSRSLDYRGAMQPGYCVFGKVTKGFEICQKIEQSKTTMVRGFRDVPSTPVVIESITVKAAAPAKTAE